MRNADWFLSSGSSRTSWRRLLGSSRVTAFSSSGLTALTRAAQAAKTVSGGASDFRLARERCAGVGRTVSDRQKGRDGRGTSNNDNQGESL